MFILPFFFYGCETIPNQNNKINQIQKQDNEIGFIKAKINSSLPSIKVGLLLPLSGENSTVGKSLLRAAQLSLAKTQNKDIKLIIKDTQSINKNIIRSYYELINENVDIILGPVFTDNIKLISPLSIDEEKIMITFSNNTEIKNKNTFISGTTPENEIVEIFRYALSKGKRKFAIILPNNNYGKRSKKLIENLLKINNGEVSKIVFYEPADPDFYQVSKIIANYDSRKIKLSDKLDELKENGSPAALKEYDSLKNKDTLGELDFESLYIGVESIKHLSMITSVLPYYDVDPKEVLYLGNSLWSNNIAAKEPALEKGVFPDTEHINYEFFRSSYFNTFNNKPHKIASLAYDLVGLISAMQLNNQKPSFDNLVNKTGFIGSKGLFRFKADGNIERSLTIYQIRNEKINVIQKADLNFN